MLKKQQLEKQEDIIHEQNQMEMLEIKNMISEKNPPSGLICRLEATEQTIRELEDM